MNAKYNLSPQEYTIMQILWEHDQEMTLAEIDELLKIRNFKPSIGTVKTYLQRLVKKEALTTKKSGHKLLYSPATNETGYEQKWAQSFLEKSYHGSLNAFICALTGNSKLTEEEKKILKGLYDE
ncbi:MAG: BlaI/MecI/CopY family transcriptional regulator [Eubacteriales bacterium]|nr:BlaI/MecI/CopY family transcriptional regulator [Eubacteriales bacterium]